MQLPKPPVKNMTDFVVFAFVSIVAVILIGAVVTVIVLEIMDPSTDTSTITGALADITTTLIGALVGFIAGKGTGHQEAREQQDMIDQQRREDAQQNQRAGDPK